MNIRFISSLTPQDEDRVAPALLAALSHLLDLLPIAYTIRIETASGRVFPHHGAQAGERWSTSPDGAAAESRVSERRDKLLLS